MQTIRQKVLNSAEAAKWVQKRISAGENRADAEDFALVMIGSSFAVIGNKQLAEKVFNCRV
jgi:hypothetical protein